MHRGIHGMFGAALLLAAAIASLAGVEWVRTWFYQLAWWGYILVVDAALRLKTGGSLLSDRPGAFFRLAFWSAFFWYGFELVNLRIANWHYLGAHPWLPLRWAGGAAAFATVLPAVLITHQLLKAFGLLTSVRVKPIPRTTAWYLPFWGLGLAMLGLAMAWPGIFFPLVWGFLVFLLEPVNHAAGLPSLMRQWEQGDLAEFARLLVAGPIVGLLWEAMNFLGGARWEYTIPYLASPKLFAMPLAGFGGYPPFAVECWVFASSLGLIYGLPGWPAAAGAAEGPGALPAWGRAVAMVAATVFMIWMAGMIDAHLVRSLA